MHTFKHEEPYFFLESKSKNINNLVQLLSCFVLNVVYLQFIHSQEKVRLFMNGPSLSLASVTQEVISLLDHIFYEFCIYIYIYIL